MSRFTTLEVMLNLLAKERRRSVSSARTELVDLANKIRELFYNMYEDVPLFEDDGECFEVQSFVDDCNTCESAYCGITLPDSMISVAGMWLDGSPVKLNSSWREYKTGFQPSDSCRLQSFQVIGRAPTECDIYPIGCSSKFGLMSESEEDDGKIAVISYYDIAGQVVTDNFELCRNTAVISSRTAKGFPDRGIRLPGNLVGSVSIFQEGGAGSRRTLSKYAPHQTVPSFTRYKITGVDAGDIVFVRGARRYAPVYFDTDVVETDNSLAIENASRYLEQHAATNQESAIKAEIYLRTAKEHLIGQKARELNKTTVRKFKFGSQYQPRVSGLHSKR